MTIGCWTISNLSSLINLFVSLILYYFNKDYLFISIFTICLTIQLNPYYLLLLAPLILHFNQRKFSLIFIFVTSSILFLCLNLYLEENWKDMFRNTFGFLLVYLFY
ncbi:unnamed protein product [Meloidogyne enterolobii]|uniref:Uncharacterized protein n=1 Tax=Meloidogyne enterolobii TaxID=390850 RepID=A0ACB0ZQZ1_MELEN